MEVLLLTAPITQLNTPYPATAYLTGFLRQQNIIVNQADFSIELICKLFSRAGLLAIASEIERTERTSFFLKNLESYLNQIEPVISFLQGKDPSLALRIYSRNYLVEGPRFWNSPVLQSEESFYYSFGSMGVQDAAKYLATLFLDDLADLIQDAVDPYFSLSRYGEKLAASQPDFGVLLKALNRKQTLIDRLLEELTVETLRRENPNVVGISIPFPGNVYGAFKIAQVMKRENPNIKIIFGGGFPNTELRNISDERVFDFIDFLTLDDGEKPFLKILDYIKTGNKNLLRTFICENGKIEYVSTDAQDVSIADWGTPVYDGLPLEKYLSIVEMLNPMHRLWSEYKWNKLTLAHGCYWKKCSFCDLSLDYINRYDPATAEDVVKKMEVLIDQTKNRGFHFVDEAAPPKLLKALSQKIIEKKLQVTWWGNVRFEKTFDADLAQLMAQAGCVAVSGGLEVASDRLLNLMNKGVSVEQVARVTQSFRQAGIFVHAYLMYGFPSETLQETIDSLERVRQLFEAGCIQSAYWHRFSATVHSPIGQNPEKFGIQVVRAGVQEKYFAENDLRFIDSTECDHGSLTAGLNKALYNYMLGVGFDVDLSKWFDVSVPRAKVSPRLIQNILDDSY